jgi:D-alanyl-D-alanine carboxypeptidase
MINQKVVLFGFFQIAFALACFSCSKPPQSTQSGSTAIVSGPPIEALLSQDIKASGRQDFIEDFWSASFDRANLPDSLKESIIIKLTQGPDFIMELLSVLEGDPYLYVLVDKQHSLSRDYVPPDLVELAEGSYRVTRQGLMLRRAAADSLEAMASAARSERVILTAASAYRSYDYQVEVYNRNVREMGREAADRESARPGHSQHQLGLVLDFYPIDDAFASTTAFVWLQKNAGRFGWSLSYPEAHEHITGYRWESWHYRYLGQELASFTNKYFEGIQQYALQFIHAWLEASD